MVTFVVDGDEVTFVDEGSFVVTVEEKAPDIEDCFRVAAVEWQVLVSSWVNRLALEEVPFERRQFDFHSLATYCDSFDVIWKQQNCDFVVFDESVALPVDSPSTTDAGTQTKNVTLRKWRAVSAMSSEIVGIELVVVAVVFEQMEIGAIVVVDFAVDGSDSSDLSGTASAGEKSEPIDLLNGHSSFGPIENDRKRDVELLVREKIDVELHSRRPEALEFVVVASRTFGGRFAGSAGTFFVGIAADVEIEELLDSLAEESCYPSYFAEKDMPIAFV